MRPFFSFRPHPLALAVGFSTLVVAGGMGLSPVAHAQQATNSSQAVDAEIQNFDIPAGPLSRVLSQFAGAAGVAISFDGSEFNSVQSEGLQGRYTVEQGFATLLRGTDVIAQRQANGDYALQRTGMRTLSPLVVEGDRENVAGPIEGFRAERSSSATNINAPLIKTPATVNVVSSDMLERLNVRRLDDILQYVPGASPGASGGALTNTFTIRGFQSSTTRGGNLGARANSVYIDGNRPAARRYHFDRSLYDRVEVLKGTSSVLYGTASPGGIVHYRSKQPEFEASQELGFTLGDFDTRRATVDVTGPIGDSGVAYRLISTLQKANQTFTGENHSNSYDDRLIFKPQIAWYSEAGTRVNLAYEYSEQENIADPGIIRFSDGSFGFNGPSLVSDQSYSEQANHIFTGSIQHPITDHWSTTLAASYGNSNVEALWDTANTRSTPDKGELIDRDIIKFETDFDHKEGRVEFEGLHQWGKVDNTTTLGFTARREGYNTNRVQSSQRNSIDPQNPVFVPVADLGPYTRNMEWTIEEKGAYLQNYAQVGEKLNIFGGLRYVDVETDFRNDGGSDNAIDYSLGAVFNQNAWLNPFVSYSTSLTPQVGTLATGEPVPFSEGEQIEVGLKSEWLDNNLATTVSAFEIEQSNQVESDPDDRSLSIVTGDQNVRGFELEAVGKVAENFTATAGYSYLDAEYTTSTRYEGNRPVNVPRHKVSGMLNYSLTTQSGLWDLGLGVVHAADRAGDDENSFDLPDYTRLDASIGWQREQVSLRLAMENLLDEEYVSGSSGVFANQGLPRSVFLTVDLEM
ncbi:MAG: TonB-dependent siderophore receptor [Marinobacter adhaerens]